jgi:heptosyltransferase-2
MGGAAGGHSRALGYAGARGWLLSRAAPRRARAHQSDYYRHPPPRWTCWTPRTEGDRPLETRAGGRASAARRGRALTRRRAGAAHGHANACRRRESPRSLRLTREHHDLRARQAAGDRTPAATSNRGCRQAPVSSTDRLHRPADAGRRPERCAAFVSNDSGAMHSRRLPACRSRPSGPPTSGHAPVGDADVLVHPVFCRPCMLRDCPIDHRCMKGITEDVVLASVRGGWGAATPAGSSTETAR